MLGDSLPRVVVGLPSFSPSRATGGLCLVDSLLPLEIPRAILEEAYREARIAYPAECCGWLSGPRDGTVVTAIRPCINDQASGGHPSVAGRTAENAYTIAASDLLQLVYTLDGETPAQVIYHSHPNGRAYFSDKDKEIGTSPWGDEPAYPVQQLVVGIDDHCVVEAALFAWSHEEGGFVEIARYEGANI